MLFPVADFDAQPERVAIGAFEGAAYKGMDAKSLGADDLGYLQSSLRILCGLYGVLRPYDAIRPYRLEMSTKLAVGSHANLYAYWGDALTESLNAEIDATAAPFVLNVASQEYAKSVKLAALRAPVVTANFPGPAVHAKEARGAITRYCAEQRVTRPDELRGFTGRAGEWAYVEAESTETKLVFHRGAAPAKCGSLVCCVFSVPKEDGRVGPLRRRVRRDEGVAKEAPPVVRPDVRKVDEGVDRERHAQELALLKEFESSAARDGVLQS